MRKILMICALGLLVGCFEGATGPAGKDGTNGAQGPVGATGAQGPAGSLNITTYSGTLNSSALISGTHWEVPVITATSSSIIQVYVRQSVLYQWILFYTWNYDSTRLVELYGSTWTGYQYQIIVAN